MGEDGAECIEGVGMLNFMGWPLDQSDENWPAVRRNTRKAHQVWGNLGKLIWREGADNFVLDFFTGQWCRRFYSLGQRPGCCWRQ